MYDLLNVKWGEPTFGTPSGTITWSSDLGADLTIANGYDLEDIELALQSAFDAWESVAAIDFEQVASGGEVTIGSADLLSPIVAQAGPFPVNPASLYTMTSAFIEFSINVVWAPYGDGGTDFYAVALHEIGHVIGLAHPDPADPTQIMNGVIYADDLSTTDIAGAQYIYGTDGDDVVVEQPPGAGDTAADSGGGGGGGGGALGLIVGLLALVFAMFTGGGGAAVAMAAGSVADDDSSDDSSPDDMFSALDANAHDHADHAVVDEDGMMTIQFSIEDIAALPVVDFTMKANPCGCVGLCEHIIDMDGFEDDLDFA